MQAALLIGLFGLVILASLAVAPRRASVEGFYDGAGAGGRAPGLWTLVLSQVTTWIFARSLMRSEEHTSELQSPVPSSYAVFCLNKKKHTLISVIIAMMRSCF